MTVYCFRYTNTETSTKTSGKAASGLKTFLPPGPFAESTATMVICVGVGTFRTVYNAQVRYNA